MITLAIMQRSLPYKVRAEDSCRLFFEQSPLGLCVMDSDCCFTRVNASFCELLGRSEGELLQTPFQDIVHPEDREKGMHVFSQLLRAELRSFEMEKRCLREDGSVVWVSFTVSIATDGVLPRFIVVGRDIREEKHAEEQRRVHARIQRNTLIREVNHRIKNNIQSVIGLLRFQIRHHPELGKPMQQAIERLQTVAIVHGMQGASRLGSCTLVRMVSEICESAQIQGCIKLQVLVSSDVVVADEESVPTALIVNELVANAMKHGNVRKSPIRVTLDGDNNATVIRIENAASGRDAFRIESGSGPGTGLGLVRALLPPSGASLSFKPGHGEVTAELRLFPPVIG